MQGDATKVLVGSVALYVAPTGTQLPDFNENPLTIPDGWLNPGYTDSGIELQYQPSIKDVNVDEELAPVKKILSAEKAKVVATLAQATLENYHQAIAASLIAVTAHGANQVGTKKLKVGSGTLSECMVMFVGQSPEGFFRCFYATRAMAAGNVQSKYQRQSQALVQLELDLLADGTLPAGERLFSIVDMVADKG